MKYAKTFIGIRKNYHFIPNGDTILMSSRFAETNLIEGSPATISIEEVTPQTFYACRYEKDWYFRIVIQVSIENNVNVKLIPPIKPASKNVRPTGDNICWVPAKNVICEVNPPEVSTTRKPYHFQDINF